jgi:hypothetical protein
LTTQPEEEMSLEHLLAATTLAELVPDDLMEVAKLEVGRRRLFFAAIQEQRPDLNIDQPGVRAVDSMCADFRGIV